MQYLLAFQGAYCLTTGIWPLLNIHTFEAVTGEKTDNWLVMTVGVLAAVIGTTILVGSRHQPPNRETLLLATLSAMGFDGVDVVFVVAGIISEIYLVDAAIQIALLIALLVTGVLQRRSA